MPAKVRGVVFIACGFGEHTSRYDVVATHLNAHGYVVFAMDNQGMGLSEGKPLYVERFDHYVRDVLQFMRHILLNIYAHCGLASLPCVVLGHSLGGLIAAHVAAQLCMSHGDGHSDDSDANKSDVAKATPPKKGKTSKAAAEVAAMARGLPRPRVVVLSGPAVATTIVTPGPLFYGVARVVSCCVPKLPVGKRRVKDISRNPAVVTFAANDPAFGRTWLRARFGSELLQAQRRAMEEAATHLHVVPLLILHGEKDALCPVSGSRALLARVVAAGHASRPVTAAVSHVGGRDSSHTHVTSAVTTVATATLRTYAGCGHEVLTECCYAQVLDDVARFIDAHCDSNRS